MANPYPANFETLDGARRLTGQVNFTDPANQPTYTAPITRESCFGSAVTIANSGTGFLTWDGSNGPDVLLDRSTLSVPSVITSGVYFVAVCVAASALTVNGSFRLTLELDQANDDVLARQDTTAPGLLVTVSLMYFMLAGGTIRAEIRNGDGAASRDFTIVDGLVQRVS